MGKKDKKDKKHKGIEKTAMKTERNLEKKTKKLLKEKGEVSVSISSNLFTLFVSFEYYYVYGYMCQLSDIL